MRVFSRRLAVLCCLVGGVAWTAAAADAPVPKRKGGEGGGRAQQARSTAGQWWREIDTGPFISDTFLDNVGNVAALKGLAIKIGVQREATVVFDTELLAWRAGFDGAVLLNGTPWD